MIAKEHKLKVIYDAAHAFGVTIDGQSAATLGDISMFSFHATKVFHTIEGRCLSHNNKELKEIFSAWCQFGMFDGETSSILGTNAKMNEFSASMGICNLRHVTTQIQLRKQVVAQYQSKLSGIPGLKIWKPQENVSPNYAYFPIQVNELEFGKSRDDIIESLKCEQIFARKYFYPLTSDFEIFKKTEKRNLTPIAKKVSDEILCLPLYPGLPMEEVDRICNIITR